MCRQNRYPRGTAIRKAPAQRKPAGAVVAFYTPRPKLGKLSPVICFWKHETPPKSISGGVRLSCRFWSTDPSPQPRAPLPAGQGLRRRDPDAKPQDSQRQTVLPVGLHDQALLASLGNGQLRGALGTSGETHDLLAELVVASSPPRPARALVTSCCSTFFRSAALDGARPAVENHNV